MSDPYENPELYTTYTLGGKAAPGRVTFSGHDSKVGWDIKKGTAQSGASMSRSSEDPIEFLASHYLVKDVAEGIDDLAEWPAFRDLINSTTSGAEPKALDIYAPDLAEQGITSVVKGTILGRVWDDKGGCTIGVKYIQYKPAKKSGGAPAGSKATTNKNDPDAQAKSELARLTAEYKATPWG